VEIMSESQNEKLTVAVTGPTGDVGRAVLRALDTEPRVARVIGMARSPFDPSEMGLNKVEYRRGDVMDVESVEGFVEGADVVLHLAFMIWGSKEETRKVNLEGTGNVFRSAFNAGAKRLIYTSSVAAYGFHDDNPAVLTEEAPPRGSRGHYYSEQKAELEQILEEMATGSKTDTYVFRPCIVAGPTALALIEKLPYVRIGEKLPDGVMKLVTKLPLLRPIIPDPGVPFQLVHEDDVASAILLAALGEGEPGVYNLAAEGEIDLSDLAHALGWYAVPLPELAIDATVKVVSKLPYLPAEASWINAIKVPVIVDATKARTKLGWKPAHDALDTLAETISAAREKGLLAHHEP
jgi:UDP-glucose 4-epimerase